MEWLEEQDGATGRTSKKDYEEKLREVEEVCGPVIKQVYEKSAGSASAADEDDVNEL